MNRNKNCRIGSVTMGKVGHIATSNFLFAIDLGTKTEIFSFNLVWFEKFCYLGRHLSSKICLAKQVKRDCQVIVEKSHDTGTSI